MGEGLEDCFFLGVGGPRWDGDGGGGGTGGGYGGSAQHLNYVLFLPREALPGLSDKHFTLSSAQRQLLAVEGTLQ